MSDKLKIDLRKEGGACKVVLSGSIDEDSNLEVIAQNCSDEIHFDFAGIEMINSCGIREWTSFIKTLPQNSVLKYFNCPPEVIEQINMIVDFLGDGASVENFYAPYFCEKCDCEQRIHLESGDITDGKAPEKECPECKGLLDFDALEDQFFAFLK